MIATGPTLRPYQIAALEATRAAFLDGKNRVLLKAPTGTGKTVMFAELLKFYETWLREFPRGDRRMLVIAHREELLDQAADKILRGNPGIMVSVEQGDRRATSNSDVVIASIQTLAARGFRRLKGLLAHGRGFRLVVVDEAHHAAASTYRGALALLGFLPMAEGLDEGNVEAADWDEVEAMEAALQGWDARAPKDQLLLGVTATPNRSDAIGLGCVFQTIAFSYALRQAILDQWLVPIKPWVIETRTSLDDVKIRRGEFDQKQLAETVNTPERNKLAVAGWLEYAGDRSTLAFSVDVAHAHALAAEFQRQGVKAEALSGETPSDERRGMLRRYTAGELQVITNCMVLTEGTDLPRTGCILHAKPTKSATLYEQMTGRGLRIHPGKTDCIVLDIVDVARRHSLQAAPALYGLPPGVMAQGKTLDELKDIVDKVLDKCPGIVLEGKLTLEQLNARATTFDIWTIRSMESYGEGLSMDWIRIEDEGFRLQYPTGARGGLPASEALIITKDLLGHFQIDRQRRTQVTPSAPNRRAVWDVEPSDIIVSGLESAKLALQTAEEWVRSHRAQVVNLTDREAAWRLRPASEKQINALRKMGAPVKPGLTMGEASAMFERNNARSGR